MKCEKEITVNLAVGKKAGFLLIFLAALILIPLNLSSENLEVRTYYPFPYGSYHHIVASDYVEVGGTSYTANRMRMGNLTTNPYNPLGVEAPQNDIYLLANDGLSVNALATVGMINFAQGRLMRMCLWVSKVSPACSNSSLPIEPGVAPADQQARRLERWQPFLHAHSYNGGYYTYYNSPGTGTPGTDRNPWYNHGLHDMTLCCRIEGR